ncbi:uncharacterized protein LOC141657406 isoform X1 [Silene latifolia]|uniref:uncharacterized protein LOC141657406 isoform X1 n=1 Tax=Silene latifolia TaxID=37657 RepID=UPI003D77AC9F
MEGLKYSEANLTVLIQPSKTGAVTDAIKQQLSSSLFKYNETFDGVLLAYDFVIKSNLAKILSLYPFVGVSLKATLLLFDPKPDTYLEGKVVKLAQDAIHVVILGFSAAIITDENIRDEFKFKIKHGREIFRSTSHKRHVIKLGTTIRFLVKSFDEETLHISGSLEQPTTGDIRWLSKNSGELFSAGRRSSRKRSNVDGTKEELSSGTVDVSALFSDNRVLKKLKTQRL